MHDTNFKDKLRGSTVRMKVRTPCSAVIRCDPHSFYRQRSLPLEAAGQISRDRHAGQYYLPFEPHRIRAGSNAYVSSASEGPAGSSYRGSQGEDEGDRSQDLRIASFGEPLLKIPTYTIDSLNLVICHKPLFPTAGRHNRQGTCVLSIYLQEINRRVTIVLFVGDSLEHHSVSSGLSTRTSQFNAAYLPELIASLSFLGSYSYPAS